MARFAGFQIPYRRLAWLGRIRPGIALLLGTILAGADPTPPTVRPTSDIPVADPGGSSVTAAAVPAPGTGGESAALKGEAVRLAEAAATAYPEDALTHALLGSACYNTGRSEEAVRHLRRCLELAPNQADAWEVLALIAYEKGDPEEAIRLCLEALKRGTGNPELLNRLGRAYLDLGRTEEAVNALRQAVALPKPVSESSYLLGQAWLQSGEPANARESFLRAIALLPDHTQAFFGAFTACTRLGQTNEAARYREQFQKLEASDRQALTREHAQDETRTGLPQVQASVARTFFGAAQIHARHGNPVAAAELLRRAAELDPDGATYRFALEAHFAELKQPEEGLKVFEQLIATQPRNTLNHYFTGRLLRRMGRPDAAERSFRRVIELTPDWAEGHRILAELLAGSGERIPEAVKSARKAAELEPTGAHYALLAACCLRHGDRDGAILAARRAVALSPDDARYRRLLDGLEPRPSPTAPK